MPRSSEGKGPGKEASGEIDGFRFNSIAEEPTRQVLTPRVDPAARRRTLVILILAVLAVLLLAFLTINPFGTETRNGSPGGNRAFRPNAGEPGM